MNADDARRESAFMDWYLPKNKQRSVPEGMKRDYCGAMDPGHTVITFLGPMADVMWDLGSDDMTYELYNSDGELEKEEQKQIPRHDNSQRVTVNREWLLKLLTPMTSDWVIFEAATDYPLRVIGKIGDEQAAAYISPRLED